MLGFDVVAFGVRALRWPHADTALATLVPMNLRKRRRFIDLVTAKAMAFINRIAYVKTVYRRRESDSMTRDNPEFTSVKEGPCAAEGEKSEISRRGL